jgi:hydrogenase maturation protease
VKAALIGLGNILLRDEGIGVHVVNAVKERYDCSEEVDILDGGTMGLDLLPHFEGREKILLVDAVDFGKEPGYVGVLEDDDIPSALSTKFSVHHIGLSDIIFVLKLMGKSPGKMCLIGIQPESMEVGLEMTDAVGGKLDFLVDMCRNKFQEWNISCV